MTVSNTPNVIEDLLQKIQTPTDGTLSITLEQNEHMKVVLFGFAAGQELSEHTASVPAVMQQISGESHWLVGNQEVSAKPGTWVSMPAKMPHSITATSASVMLLTMLRNVADASAKCSCDSE